MIDVSYWSAFIAGLISFLSPCILPIVPFYLAFLAGESIANGRGIGTSHSSFYRTACALSFALGVITIFAGLGATASVFGQALRSYFDVLKWVASGIIILMGLHYLGWFQIRLLGRQFRLDLNMGQGGTLGKSYVIGLAFAFGWTPCVGPILSLILFLASSQDGLSEGVALLIVYGSGMTLPFIAAAFFIEPFLRLSKRFRNHLGRVEKLIGISLLIFGILIATDMISRVANMLWLYVPFLQNFG